MRIEKKRSDRCTRIQCLMKEDRALRWSSVRREKQASEFLWMTPVLLKPDILFPQGLACGSFGRFQLDYPRTWSFLSVLFFPISFYFYSSCSFSRILSMVREKKKEKYHPPYLQRLPSGSWRHNSEMKTLYHSRPRQLCIYIFLVASSRPCLSL